MPGQRHVSSPAGRGGGGEPRRSQWRTDGGEACGGQRGALCGDGCGTRRPPPRRPGLQSMQCSCMQQLFKKHHNQMQQYIFLLYFL